LNIEYIFLYLLLTESDEEDEVTDQAPLNGENDYQWLSKEKQTWNVPQNSKIDERKLKVNPDLEAGLSKNSSPIEFFNLFVTCELLDMILEQTQLYTTYQSLNNSKDEITTEWMKSQLMISRKHTAELFCTWVF
jgi:hypothetical protein